MQNCRDQRGLDEFCRVNEEGKVSLLRGKGMEGIYNRVMEGERDGGHI